MQRNHCLCSSFKTIGVGSECVYLSGRVCGYIHNYKVHIVDFIYLVFRFTEHEINVESKCVTGCFNVLLNTKIVVISGQKTVH